MSDDRPMSQSDDVVASRLREVRETIAEVGRDGVRLIAVTKGFDRSAIDCAQRLGLTDVGENYAQEVQEKALAIGEHTSLHFIGRIQRNKVRKIVDVVDLWHSVARPEILVEIGKRAESPTALIQVRPLDDESKDGVLPADLDHMFEVARSNGVHIAGLMTIGVFGDAAGTKAAFVELDRLATEYNVAERSMGMSGDYRDALEAGATMLRLGSVLFGDRPSR